MALRKKQANDSYSVAPEPVMETESYDATEMEFIDLRDWVSPRAEEYAEDPKLMIRSVEIARPEDVSKLMKLFYDGELLLLDFQPLANDNAGFKAALNHLQRAVYDQDGDLAGLGRNYLIAAPKGARIARHKVRFVGSSEAFAEDED